MSTDYSLISPTAKVTAHLRAETGIPYSKEIDILCDCKKATDKVFNNEDMGWKAPKIELRYKALSKVLENEIAIKGISQVLELAAGILPRGMIMSANPHILYIETDLLDVVEEKKKLVADIDAEILKRGNYLVTSLNGVDTEEFNIVTTKFRKDKVAVINEGLLAYLSVSEKEILARNIHSFLLEYGGVWITPDLSNAKNLEKIEALFPNASVTNKMLSDAVGRDMRTNSIPGGKESAIEFYKNIGFSITEYKVGDLNITITSLSKITDIEKRQRLQEVLNDSCVWALEPIKT